MLQSNRGASHYCIFQHALGIMSHRSGMIEADRGMMSPALRQRPTAERDHKALMTC